MSGSWYGIHHEVRVPRAYRAHASDSLSGLMLELLDPPSLDWSLNPLALCDSDYVNLAPFFEDFRQFDLLPDQSLRIVEDLLA